MCSSSSTPHAANCVRSDRLGVITRTLFSQRDFTDTSILDDFHSSLEHSLHGQLTESGLYMGVYRSACM